MASISDYIRLPSSEVRLEVIVSLLDGAKPLSELKSELNRRSTTILHTLNDLAQLKIIEQVEKDYKLTSIGIIEGILLKASIDISEVIVTFQNFWLNHDISGIPKTYLQKIGDLKNSRLIKSEDVHLGKVHESYLVLLESSKWIKGISPVFHPDFLRVYENLLNEGANIDLILTEDIIEEILSNVNIENIVKFIEKEQLKIYQAKKISVGITVTDKVISLGLFNVNGRYDYNVDLVSSDPSAREWGVGLFEDYKKESVEIQTQLGIR